ncbi:MAG: winged helix-turn-helix domain-containing protein [Desulfovibrionaceae bacterium]
MKNHQPTVRLHLWLESRDMTVFGYGRVFLLDLIEEHGSLRKAARCLGMSYRAAWGKLHASESALGVKLVETTGNRRDGCRLSSEGRRIRDMFKQWFQAVEEAAVAKADAIFPWDVASFDDVRQRPALDGDRPGPPPDTPKKQTA